MPDVQTFPDQQDIPPMPVMTAPPTPTPPPSDSNVLDIPPIIAGSSSPKGRRGKIIATILGILLLVGAIGAGVILVGQKQLFQQKASSACAPADCIGTTKVDVESSCELYNGYCKQNWEIGREFTCDGSCKYSFTTYGKCKSETPEGGTCPAVSAFHQGTCCVNATPTPTPDGGGGGGGQCDDGSDPNGCVKYVCPYGDTNSDNACGEADEGVSWNFIDGSCSDVHCGTQCCQIDWTKNQTYCGFKEKNLSCAHEPPPPTPSHSPSPTPKPTARPTPTGSPTAPMCTAVKAYDTSWNLLTGAQLSALSAGNKVRFTVSGIPADQIDKARFTINGVLGSEVTVKKPTTDEYYIEYIVPTGVYSFTVTAQIHHSTLGWF